MIFVYILYLSNSILLCIKFLHVLAFQMKITISGIFEIIITVSWWAFQQIQFKQIMLFETRNNFFSRHKLSSFIQTNVMLHFIKLFTIKIKIKNEFLLSRYSTTWIRFGEQYGYWWWYFLSTIINKMHYHSSYLQINNIAIILMWV